MKLRALRDKRKITQEALSDMSGVDQSTISAIETGRLKSPSWQIVAKLARSLEVAPEKIFPVEHNGTAA